MTHKKETTTAEATKQALETSRAEKSEVATTTQQAAQAPAETKPASTEKKRPIQELFDRADVRKRFEEMLGKRAPQFITSVLQIASTSLPADVDIFSVYNAAATAATLDLPLNNNLGFAYIVSYNKQIEIEIADPNDATKKIKQKIWKPFAQFQMGYKGFIQLSQRSGQFLTIAAKEVFDGQLVDDDSFEGFRFDWKAKKSDTVIGFAAYFKLLNGFEKILYMTADDLKAHGLKFSQTFKKGYGLWKDAFESMALKTVLKLLLSKYAPLSVEMQKAVVTDSSIIIDADANEVEYIDNAQRQLVNPHEVAKQKERDRIIAHINESTSKEMLAQVADQFTNDDEELVSMYNEKFIELTEPKMPK